MTRTASDTTTSPTSPSAGATPSADVRATTTRAGIGPAITAVTDAIGRAVDGPVRGLPLSGRLARLGGRVHDAIGAAYAVTVDDDHVRTRRIVRGEQMDWAEVRAVEVEPVGSVVGRRVLGWAGRRLASRMLPLPAVRRVAGPLVDQATRPVSHLTSRLPGGASLVVVGLCGDDGDKIDIDGPLALSTLLSRRLNNRLLSAAAARGVPTRPAGT